MKINCGPTLQEYQDWILARRIAKDKLLREWHDFFPLFPRRVGSRDCRWLETIQRKGELLYRGHGRYEWEWEYRAKE